MGCSWPPLTHHVLSTHQLLDCASNGVQGSTEACLQADDTANPPQLLSACLRVSALHRPLALHLHSLPLVVAAVTLIWLPAGPSEEMWLTTAFSRLKHLDRVTSRSFSRLQHSTAQHTAHDTQHAADALHVTTGRTSHQHGRMRTCLPAAGMVGVCCTHFASS